MDAVQADEKKEGRQFGEVAVRLGYCSSKDVESALARQRTLRNDEGRDELIGMIMLEEGMLTTDQLISVLRVLEHKHKKELPESV